MEIEIEASTTSGRNVTLTKNKRTNSVWEHFQINEAKKKFYCNYCKGNNRHAFDYSSHDHSSTTVAKHHLRIKHIEIFNQLESYPKRKNNESINAPLKQAKLDVTVERSKAKGN